MNKDRNAFDRYMDEIDRPDLLTDDEERQLAQRIQLGDSRAIDRLTKANLTYVVSLARQYINRGLAFEDLVSEGNIGMLRAAAKYTADSGKRFVAFAAPYIREAMDEAARRQGGLYRVPRNAENAALENKRRRALSIDQPMGGSAELSLGRVIPDRDAPIPNEAVERGADGRVAIAGGPFGRARPTGRGLALWAGRIAKDDGGDGARHGRKARARAPNTREKYCETARERLRQVADKIFGLTQTWRRECLCRPCYIKSRREPNWR